MRGSEAANQANNEQRESTDRRRHGRVIELMNDHDDDDGGT